VLAELKWDARVQPNEIGVSVKNGVVTVTGSVDSYAKKWAAEEAAHRVRGVKAVANDIEVRLPGSDKRTDEDIAAAAVPAHHRDAPRPHLAQAPLAFRHRDGALRLPVRSGSPPR
jgi:hypothetical protein